MADIVERLRKEPETREFLALHPLITRLVNERADAAGEIERLCRRVEELRGLCKWASGRLFEAGQIDDANRVLELIGDMEP